MAATRTDKLARRYPSSPHRSHRPWLILVAVLVIAAVMTGILFALSPRDATSVSPNKSVAQINAPPIEEIVQILQVEEPVVEKIIQVQKPVVHAPGSAMNPLPPEAISTTVPFKEMRVMWSVAPEGIDIPPLGEEPLSGTIDVKTSAGITIAMNTRARVAWFEEMLPEIDLNGTIVAGAQDENVIFVLVNDEFTLTARLFLSQDKGSSWDELNMPDNWDEHIVSRIRVMEDEGSARLFLSFSGKTWWTTTVN